MLTSEQIRAARALLRWEQRDLAQASKVSLPSIKRLETKHGPLAAYDRTAEAIQSALEAAGVIFVAENGEGPGVRLCKDFELIGRNAELRGRISSKLNDAPPNVVATIHEMRAQSFRLPAGSRQFLLEVQERLRREAAILISAGIATEDDFLDRSAGGRPIFGR